MNVWWNCHLYSSNIDALVRECVHPLLMTMRPFVSRGFWERHYAGGRHVRVRLYGDEEAVRTLGAEIVTQGGQYLREHPSPIDHTYSVDVARQLLIREEEPVDEDDLIYRVNEVRVVPYQRLRHTLASDEAAWLVADVLHYAVPLLPALLTDAASKTFAVAQLYFLVASIGARDVRRGCVSYRSHWEGFAAHCRSRALIDRIRDTYADRHPVMVDALRAVVEPGSTTSDSTRIEQIDLTGWRQLFTQIRQQVDDLIAAGVPLVTAAKTRHDVRELRELMRTITVRESAFLETLFDDDRFIAAAHLEPGFIRPRVLVNLLYTIVACTGLTPLNKMALCHDAYRCVETHYDCDLMDTLRDTIERLVARHGARVAEGALD